MLQASQAIPEVPDDATCTVYTTNDFQVQLWATSTSIWESGASWSNLLDRINLEQSRLWSDSFAAKLHFGHLWTICKHCKLLIRSTQTIVELISSNSISFIWFSKKVYLVRKKTWKVFVAKRFIGSHTFWDCAPGWTWSHVACINNLDFERSQLELYFARPWYPALLLLVSFGVFWTAQLYTVVSFGLKVERPQAPQVPSMSPLLRARATPYPPDVFGTLRGQKHHFFMRLPFGKVDIMWICER